MPPLLLLLLVLTLMVVASGLAVPPPYRPRCDVHKAEAVVRVSRRKGKMFGRPYFACSRTPPCSFFRWAPAGTLAGAGPVGEAEEPAGPTCLLSLCAHRGVTAVCLEFAPFSWEVVAQARIVAARHGGRYDQDTKTWLFPLTALEPLREALRDVEDATIDDVPEAAFVDAPTVVERGRNSTLRLELPAALDETLLPFQREAALAAVENGGRVLFADDPGLGKTFQALSVLCHYRKSWPALIVAPASLVVMWRETLLQWAEVREEDIFVVKTGAKKDFVASAGVTIASYDLARALVKNRCFEPGQFDVVVCDESHMLKNAASARAQAVLPLVAAARDAAVLVTGTPALNRPAELWSQLSALAPGTYGAFDVYGARYCRGGNNKFDTTGFSGASCLAELDVRLRRDVMVRRLKAEVLSLPAKTRSALWLNGTKDEAAVLRSDVAHVESAKALEALLEQKRGVEKTLKMSPEDPLGLLRDVRASLMTEAYSETGRAKEPLVMLHLKRALGLVDDNDDDDGDDGDDHDASRDRAAAPGSRYAAPKILVFAHHRHLVKGIADMLAAEGVGHIVIDGATPPAERLGLCGTFNTDDDCRVAVLSIKAAGVGLTLTAATLALFAELDWSPAGMAQAEDRLHRIGQVEDVAIEYLLYGEFDAEVLSILRRKAQTLRSLVGDADGAVGIEAVFPE